MVGNEVNCDDQMSADIASIPSWKIALLQRKRIHDKDSSCANDSHTPSGPLTDQQAVGDTAVPPWKRDILVRKQNQKNSLVFLARSGQTGDGLSNDSLATLSNGHVHSLVHSSHCDSVEPAMDTTIVDIDIKDTTEDQPVEERLLPIHQNPILRLDLKKRHRSSSGSTSTRSSLSPRAKTSSAGSRECSTVSSVSSQAPVTPDTVNEEVFRNDNDAETEVAYGKGFVHKLLMKFSHLTSSGNELAPNNRLPKQQVSGLTKLSGVGSQRKSSRDLGGFPSGMPAVRVHSADDLLNETKLHVRFDCSDSGDELDITATNDLNEEGDYRNEDGVSLKRISSCSEIPNELPFANIVSNARSLFESLAVHSTSQKRSASPSFQPTTSSRFSYIGTLERSKQPRSSSVTKAYEQDVSTLKMNDQSSVSVNSSAELTAEGLKSNEPELQRNADARFEVDADADRSVQESGDRRSRASLVSPTSVYTNGSVLHQNVNISNALPSQHVFAHVTINSDVQLMNSHSKEQKCDNIPTTSTTQSETAAEEPHLFTDEAKKSIMQNSVVSNTAKSVPISHSSEPSDNKENVKSQLASSGKKPSPTRPGKLVIRPASNLVAAKTSSEYLELTKFNDVRKGEFAPPAKKERIDLDMCDDDMDKVDGVTSDPVITEEYVFAGAGVVIGRSLLTKTNKNKSVSTMVFYVVQFFVWKYLI